MNLIRSYLSFLNMFVGSVVLVLFCSTLVQAEPVVLRGLLKQESSNFLIITPTAELALKVRNVKPAALRTLVGSYLEIKGERQGQQILISAVPTIVSGTEMIVGTLRQDKDSSEYYLELLSGRENVPARFGKVLKVNSYFFDQLSREYFRDKMVITRGNFIEQYDGSIYEINAILEHGLFAVDQSRNSTVTNRHSLFPADVQKLINEDPEKFYEQLLTLNAFSQRPQSHRGTLFPQERNKIPAVAPLDYALMITLSGRQGDATNAAGGHFSSGMARVRSDYTLAGEIFNIYMSNSKGIVSGNMSLEDYFGHLIWGQGNYRPTLTAVIYGVSARRLLKLRRLIDQFQIGMRINPGNPTLERNCTTTSVDFLKQVNVYGRYYNLFGAYHPRRTLEMIKFVPFVRGLKASSFILSHDRAEYVPRNAFQAILKNISYLNRREHLGAYRIDMIFQAQVPSKRPRGGVPLDGPLDQINATVNRLDSID